MNQDMKYGYLDETYETICPLGEQDIFLAKNRDNGRIFVKKYVAASVIPVYEKLIAIRNEHLENIYDFAAGEERGILITGYISGIHYQQPRRQDHLRSHISFRPSPVCLHSDAYREPVFSF